MTIAYFSVPLEWQDLVKHPVNIGLGFFFMQGKASGLFLVQSLILNSCDISFIYLAFEKQDRVSTISQKK